MNEDERETRDSKQAFLLLGTLMLLPIIFMYTGWSYWVFELDADLVQTLEARTEGWIAGLQMAALS